jgi:hypothetical protein
VTYWPAADEWLKESPPALGLAATGIESAIEYHCAHESRWSRDFLTASGRYIGVADEPESPDDVLGPVRPRGGPNGLILRGGAIVEEWGDTERADMSFSIAKSYLAALAGIAVGQGLIGSLDDPVRKAAPHPDLVSAQNHAITWRQLLTQTSEWQGTLWSKPDSIDHNRDLGKSELGASRKGTPRAMRPPGTLWEYNDVLRGGGETNYFCDAKMWDRFSTAGPECATECVRPRRRAAPASMRAVASCRSASLTIA